MNIYDEKLSKAEQWLIDELRGKNRMEQDQIIGEYKNAKI